MSVRLVAGWVFVLLTAFVAGELQPVRRYTWWSWPVEVMLLGVIFAALVLGPVRGAWRQRRWYVIGAVAVVVLIVTHLLSGPAYYRSAAIQARVVDSATRQPITGAAVRAEWRLRTTATLEESREAGLLHVATATTTEDGSFVLPGWQLRLRPPLRWLAREDPRLTITTLDGRTITVDNHPTAVWRNGGQGLLRPRHNPFSSARTSNWSGLDIPTGR